jgi:hypothetical protein
MRRPKIKRARVRRAIQWRVESLDESPRSLHRLVGPRAEQKNRQKTMCVAIGPRKHLEIIADALNELGVQV